MASADTNLERLVAECEDLSRNDVSPNLGEWAREVETDLTKARDACAALSRMNAALRARIAAMEDAQSSIAALRADCDALRLALKHAHDALLSLEDKTAVYDTMHTTPGENVTIIGLLHVAATRGREAAANALDGE